MSFKYLSDWGEASSYFLLNLGLTYKPTALAGWSFDLKADNILDEEIDRPEIGRNRPEVPTIPYTENPWFFVGVSYSF